MEKVVLSLDDRPVRHPYLILQESAGKRHLFHSKKNIFFELNATAYDILILCDSHYSTMDILQHLAKKYQVPAQKILEDVAEYLALLIQLEAIELKKPLDTKGGEPDARL
jgi:hypothetical protein